MLPSLKHFNITINKRMKSDYKLIRFSFIHSPTAEVEPQWKSAHALYDVWRDPDEKGRSFH